MYDVRRYGEADQGKIGIHGKEGYNDGDMLHAVVQMRWCAEGMRARTNRRIKNVKLQRKKKCEGK